MLRKLFISLLILSALTSEGAVSFAEVLHDPSFYFEGASDVVLDLEREYALNQLGLLNKKHELRPDFTLFSRAIEGCSLAAYTGSTDIQSKIFEDETTLDSSKYLRYLFPVPVIILLVSVRSILLYRSDLSPPVCIN